MFHPKQSSLSALMSRVSGKRIGRLLAFIPRHPLLAGAGVLSYLAFADADNSARLYAAVSDKDFPETALAALIFSGLSIAVAYGFIHFIRQVMTALHHGE